MWALHENNITQMYRFNVYNYTKHSNTKTQTSQSQLELKLNS